jgi:hypothetical protein
VRSDRYFLEGCIVCAAGSEPSITTEAPDPEFDPVALATDALLSVGEVCEIKIFRNQEGKSRHGRGYEPFRLDR